MGLVTDFRQYNLEVFLRALKKQMIAIGYKIETGLEKITRYDWAYFAGIVIFDVVLGLIITYFSGGAAAEFALARAANSIKPLLKLIYREFVSSVTLGIVDLIQLLKTLLTKFFTACSKGWKALREFIEEFFKNDLKNENKPDNDIFDLGKIFQKGGGDLNKSFAENAGLKFKKVICK